MVEDAQDLIVGNFHTINTFQKGEDTWTAEGAWTAEGVLTEGPPLNRFWKF